jgi:hypothetical protein
VLVTGEGWNNVHLWDAVTGKHLATVTAPEERKPDQHPVNFFETAFTPDGRYLFVATTMAFYVWDLVERREIGPFEQSGDGTCAYATGALEVSPDGRYLAWLNSCNQVVIYEVSSGKIVYCLDEGFSSIAFAPCGLRLATGCTADASILIWDLPELFRAQPSLCKDARPESLWDALQSQNAVQAQRALWSLATLDEADAFLERHLQPIDVLPPLRVRALLTDLGSEDFETRNRAEQALAAAEDSIRGALKDASRTAQDLEVVHRVQRLLDRLAPASPERLRGLRTVQVLEARGTPAARRLLKKLAGGASDAWLTNAAREALKRLPN